MKYKKILISVTVAIVVVFTCIKQKEPTTIEELESCSINLTSNDKFAKDPKLIFKVIYGEYAINDTININISPVGKFYYMKKVPGHWGIVMVDYIDVRIVDKKMYFKTDYPIPFQDEVLFCNNILIDKDTNIRGSLICKCIL